MYTLKYSSGEAADPFAVPPVPRAIVETGFVTPEELSKVTGLYREFRPENRSLGTDVHAVDRWLQTVYRQHERLRQMLNDKRRYSDSYETPKPTTGSRSIRLISLSPLRLRQHSRLQL